MRMLLWIIGVFVTLFAGCTSFESERQPSDRSQARNLYMELRNHSNRYIDTLRRLSDSADIIEFENRFEKGISDIYFRYPPDTDIDMTQGEQDTLWLLADRFVRLKQRRVAGVKKNL